MTQEAADGAHSKPGSPEKPAKRGWGAAKASVKGGKLSVALAGRGAAGVADYRASTGEAKTPKWGPRVKEVFNRFDTSGDGKLDTLELRRVLKTMGRKFSYRDIDRLVASFDTNKDGMVSFKELLEWVRKGPEAAEVQSAILAETGSEREAKIRETFARYDSSGDGSLDISELQQVLKSLGAFTNMEVVQVLDSLDKSGDGEVDFDEFYDWVKHGVGTGVIAKAKSILAPGDPEGLEAVFCCRCDAGKSEMNGKGFVKFFQDAGLITKTLSVTELDLIFNNTAVKPKGVKKIHFSEFEIALEIVSERTNIPETQIRPCLLELYHPILRGTKADFCRLHDDKSTYTGAHRFDRVRLAGAGGKAKGNELGGTPESPEALAEYDAQVKKAQAIEAFFQFKWAKRREWKQYEETISPVPTKEQLMEHKVKWYIENQDIGFPFKDFTELQQQRRLLEEAEEARKAEETAAHVASTLQGRRRSRDDGVAPSRAKSPKNKEDAPIVDRRELYKVFGLSTPVGRLLKRIYVPPYNPTEALQGNRQGLGRSASLPTIASPGRKPVWESPYLRYLEVRGPPPPSRLRCSDFDIY